MVDVRLDVQEKQKVGRAGTKHVFVLRDGPDVLCEVGDCDPDRVNLVKRALAQAYPEPLTVELDSTDPVEQHPPARYASEGEGDVPAVARGPLGA